MSETINDKYESYAWETGYTPADNKAQLKENVTNSGIYTAEEAQDPHTAWYWPDNKTFYHFRTVMPKTDDSWKANADSEHGDYVTLRADFGDTYKDVCWGAPFASTSGKLTYDHDVNGFDASSINLVVAVWFKPVDFLQTKNDLYVAMKQVLDEAGISIPFNQLDVHLDK